MPELPEVETILRGLIPHLEQHLIQEVRIRNSQLRWPIPSDLSLNLNNQRILHLSRRGKYLLIQVSTGTLIIHLGMSGSLRMVNDTTALRLHDHFDLVFSNHTLLRYNDPRRFGAILWTTADPLFHPLLKTIGLEPFDSQFDGRYLQQQSLRRNTNIKSFIMNSKIVAGIGNIYAAEILFLSHLHPNKAVSLLTQAQWDHLGIIIPQVLQSAIHKGGTTLKDYVNSEGKPGYFSQDLYVYGRGGLLCKVCQHPLDTLKLNQRSTVFCAHCQLE
ncbi:MAG: bifunctional DNA-formamidopyrimidine glycosylase/DNA-(apurinic or apyrimidinic site) lyase [Legionella sp.]|nr:bifunctional DNA-formamidopyrimidine glycosylase/DNA-(apurinic or apyrimidinic site) lyase [Legionella sp.]